MQFLFNLFTSYPYFELPYDWMGWLWFVLLFFAVVYGVVRSEQARPVRSSQDWLLFSILFLCGLVATLFIGFRFPIQNDLNLFEFAFIYRPVAVMIFAAIPVMLCGGLLGARYAVVIGVASGFLMGYWHTHSLFTVLEYAGLSLLVSTSIRQQYRPAPFRLMRHPLAAAIVGPLVFSPVIMLNFFFGTAGEAAVRIDYALTQSWPLILARLCEYAVAGLIGEIFFLAKIRGWAPVEKSEPLPWEKKLSLKFMVTILPIFGVAFIVLLVGDWVAAGLASRRMMEDRMSNLAGVASESLPYFLESGQNLILNYAKADLLDLHGEALTDRMAQLIYTMPFFTEMSLYNPQGALLARFPTESSRNLSEGETAAMGLAREGAPVQTLTVGLSENAHSAEIAFMARIEDHQGVLRGVLVGYTDLETNPFSQPAIEAIRAIETSAGEGWLLDEESRVVYHSDPAKVMDRYFGSFSGDARFYEQSNPGETPRYLYVARAAGRPWTLVLAVPSSQVQQMALDIAVPLLFVLALISLVVFISLRLLTNSVTDNLHSLAAKATATARGNLETPIRIADEDEVGQLAEAVERMRLGLIARIQDIHSLLQVSQGVATNLNADQALEPILAACLRKSACAARALVYETDPLDTTPGRAIRLGFGKKSEVYASLDDHFFERIQQEDQLVIPNGFRCGLPASAGSLPGAALVYAIRYKSRLQGVLWIGFERPQQFSDTDLQFYSTLAGQASLAMTNASLYRLAEVGRQRMEAILDASPEPILVFDHNHRLLLLNVAARQVQSFVQSTTSGMPLDAVIHHKVLAEMIVSPQPEGTLTREITMPGGKTYMASIAEVKVDGAEMGKICMLRDVSRYKELDTLKSEFVSTVSHDLKSPLTMMKGYATMMEWVGELNPQQKSYRQKIADGIDQMAQLVDDILDLTRIESSVGLNITRFNLVEAIEKIVSMVEVRAAQKNIQLILNESVETGVMIQTDFALLQQALLNLLENAVKYTSLGGQVEVTTRVREEAVVFEIKDNGIGISAVDVPYIFDKFYRSGNREASRQKGSGMGLAIVKTIADRLNGRVWVQSQLGKGSIFYLELPYSWETEASAEKQINDPQ